MSTPFGKRGHFFQEWDSGQHWEQVKITVEAFETTLQLESPVITEHQARYIV